MNRASVIIGAIVVVFVVLGIIVLFNPSILYNLYVILIKLHVLSPCDASGKVCL